MSAPFISYAAGLYNLTEFSVKDGEPPGQVAIAADQTRTYLTEINLETHPGVVIHPQHIVGISGDIRLHTQWVLTHLHSWVKGQLRYIIFSGTGQLYIEGQGEIELVNIQTRCIEVEDKNLLGFDTRLAYIAARTETFSPYFRGKTTLIDNRFSGTGSVLKQVFGGRTQAQTLGGKSVSFFSNLLSVIGKFFGF